MRDVDAQGCVRSDDAHVGAASFVGADVLSDIDGCAGVSPLSANKRNRGKQKHGRSFANFF